MRTVGQPTNSTPQKIASAQLLDHHLNRCKGALAMAHAALHAASRSIRNERADASGIAPIAVVMKPAGRANLRLLRLPAGVVH